MGTYTVNLHVPLGVYTIFPVVWNYGNFVSHDCWQQFLLLRICENAKKSAVISNFRLSLLYLSRT